MLTIRIFIIFIMYKTRLGILSLVILTLSVINFSILCSAQSADAPSTQGDSAYLERNYVALVNQKTADGSDEMIIRQAIKEKALNSIKNDAKAGTAEKIDAKPQQGFQNFISEYWVQFLALLVSLVGVFFAVTGFTFAGQKKKKSVANFINQIDDTFASFKWKSKRCEAELYRIEDLIEDQLKNGKIDESSYELLTKRIQKYLKEVQEIDDPVNRKRADHRDKKIAKLAEEVQDND